MDDLLCDESWLSSPLTPEPLPIFHHGLRNNEVTPMSPAFDDATLEEAISMDLKKESSDNNYGEKFLEFFVSKKLTEFRFQVVQWLIKTKSRLNLSFETVFSAANCFDRFVYETSCNEWTSWMVELLAVTSLSIASKFNEVTTPLLHELQMEGLVHRFHQNNVLKMELVMLKVLDWRVNSVTSYSFAQTLVSKMGLVGDHMVMNHITNHLLEDLCDMQMLRYSPSVVAAAAMWIVLEEKGLGGRIMDILGQEHKENIVKCVDMMKSRTMDYATSIRKSWEAKSLVSVLQRGDVMNVNGDCPIEDLSAIFQILKSDNKKRDREIHQYNIHPAKRMAI